MKKLLLAAVCLCCIQAITAQSITGLWYSGDSSRVYEVREIGNNTFEACIKSSARKKDSVGFTVIKNLQYNSHKKRYQGIIYSTADGQATAVKIKFAGQNSNKIILNLQRMFVLGVAINWTRAAAQNTSAVTSRN